MDLFDYELEVPEISKCTSPLEFLRKTVPARIADDPRLPSDTAPVRFAITHSNKGSQHCALGLLSGVEAFRPGHPVDSIFRFKRRSHENQQDFNVVFVVPTGIGCIIGGHAGDAAPAARLVASTCDRLITHPNVVNASDLNAIPENGLYVEGSVLTRLMMGTAGLAPVRRNRVLLIAEKRDDDDPIYFNSAVNALNGAFASCGFTPAAAHELSPRIVMKTDFFDAERRAGGCVENLDHLCHTLEQYEGQCDAVAITSVIDVSREMHDHYFDDCDDVINPWGGVEALLTHALSSLYNIPTAHAPMYEDRDVMNSDPNFMDPKTAAEGISVTFLPCLFKGLDKSPRIVTDLAVMEKPGVLTASDVSCLVIPDGCIGLPTLAALEQDITVIAVSENENMMENDLEALPWKRRDQFHRVRSYCEAAGLLLALREGIAPAATRRPVEWVPVTRDKHPSENRGEMMMAL